MTRNAHFLYTFSRHRNRAFVKKRFSPPETPPLIFVGNGVEYVCASNCTSDIKSENGFDHPHTTTSNVPTLGRDAVVIRLVKGNGVLYVN